MTDENLEIMEMGELAGAPLGMRKIFVKDLSNAPGADDRYSECSAYSSRWRLNRAPAKPISKIVVES